MRVLSVDDGAVMRKIVRSTTVSLVHEVFEACWGVDALTFLERHMVELILLDRNMPGLTGYDFLVQIKEDERLKDIPVMMVTTEGERKNVVKAIRAGAANYITKPFSSEDLLVKIMECTEGDIYA